MNMTEEQEWHPAVTPEGDVYCLEWLKKNPRYYSSAEKSDDRAEKQENHSFPSVSAVESSPVFVLLHRDDDCYNQLLMKLIDEQYIRRPFYGVSKITT